MANFLALFGMKSMVAAGSVAAVAAGSAVVYRDEIPKLWEQASISMPLPKAHQEPVSLVREDDGTSKPAVNKPVVTSETAPVPVPKAEEVETVKIITPTFDLLRVEPDGSVLVAGNAAPNSKVDLIDSEGKVLASAEAGPEGDFVALPDGPLAPGDYVLSLRAVRDGQEPTVSAQTSLVTVPARGDGGEVLAMISEEGKPSEIITKPETLEAKDQSRPVEEVAKVEPADETPAKLEEEAVAEAPKVETKPEEVAAVEPATTEQPAEPVKEVEVAKVEPAPKPEETVAAVEPVAEAKPEEPAAPPPQVVVEAVEVENGQVYVAGALPRGVPVRIYIDNQFIGLARGTPDARFLVSKEYDLSEGEHIVRADVIDSIDGSVLSRAVVPLVHEVPEEMQPEQKVAEVEPVKPAKVEEPVEVAALEPKTDVKPQPVEESKVETPQVETPKVAEQAPKVVEEAPKAVAETAPVAPVAPAAPAAPVAVVAPEAPKVEVVETAPEPKVEVAKVEPATPKVEVAKVEEPKVEVAKVEEPAAKVVAAKPAPPRVLKTGRAVIIKRGDNLWRISRKTYGRGIRYTTIYNANRNQIVDPDRIFIGQIFKIPEKAEQEG